MKDVLGSAASAFKAIHKRPPVLVIDGMDDIAKSNRKLAIDMAKRAKARASCHRPVAFLASSAGCEAPSACCTVATLDPIESLWTAYRKPIESLSRCLQTWADSGTIHMVFVASDGTFLEVIQGSPPPARSQLHRCCRAPRLPLVQLRARTASGFFPRRVKPHGRIEQKRAGSRPKGSLFCRARCCHAGARMPLGLADPPVDPRAPFPQRPPVAPAPMW